MFTWRYLDASGEETGRSEGFPDRDEAESWMGREWESLVAAGHAEVALHDEDTGARIYRMGLGEE